MYKNLPTDFLRSLVVIADLDSFTKAGDMLGRSQSAISLQMKKLEELVGQRLFNRQGHNFTLTPHGETLASYARQILQLNDQAIHKLNPQGFKGTIRLGIPSEFTTGILPKVLGSFSRNHPQVTLEVHCDLSTNLNVDFSNDKYDVIFTLTLLNKRVATEQHFIRNDELVWVGAKPFKLTPHEEVQLIMAPEGCLYRSQAIDYLDKMNIPWRIVYNITEISGIQAALQEDIGITVLAKSVVPDNLFILPSLETNIGEVGIQLITKDERKMPVINRLVEYIEQALI